jgi:hypothetical protein
MQVNGETIYGTRGNIYPPQDWGGYGENKTLYSYSYNTAAAIYFYAGA